MKTALHHLHLLQIQYHYHPATTYLLACRVLATCSSCCLYQSSSSFLARSIRSLLLCSSALSNGIINNCQQLCHKGESGYINPCHSCTVYSTFSLYQFIKINKTALIKNPPFSSSRTRCCSRHSLIFSGSSLTTGGTGDRAEEV